MNCPSHRVRHLLPITPITHAGAWPWPGGGRPTGARGPYLGGREPAPRRQCSTFRPTSPRRTSPGVSVRADRTDRARCRQRRRVRRLYSRSVWRPPTLPGDRPRLPATGLGLRRRRPTAALGQKVDSVSGCTDTAPAGNGCRILGRRWTVSPVSG